MINFTRVFQAIPSWLNWPISFNGPNIIAWQTLFTWLWRWLPLRLSKRQSPSTVLFRTTFTRTITLYELLILLGLNHLQYYGKTSRITRRVVNQKTSTGITYSVPVQDRFPNPFIYINLWNPHSFRAEPPRICYYRKYPSLYSARDSKQ